MPEEAVRCKRGLSSFQIIILGFAGVILLGALLLMLPVSTTGGNVTPFNTYITQQIWGSSWENDIASLRVFMATLRKKLESGKGGQQYIQTHIGIGYRMLRVEGT